MNIRPTQSKVVVRSISAEEIALVRKSIKVYEPDEEDMNLFKRDYQRVRELMSLDTFIQDIARIRKKWLIPLENDGPFLATLSVDGEYRPYIRTLEEPYDKLHLDNIKKKQQEDTEATTNEFFQWKKFKLLYDDTFLLEIGKIVRKYRLAPTWFESLLGVIKDCQFYIPFRTAPFTMVDPGGNLRHFVEISPDTQHGDIVNAVTYLRYKEYSALPSKKFISAHTASKFERNLWLWKLKREENLSYGKIVSLYKEKYPDELQGKDGVAKDDEQIKRALIREIKRMDKRMVT